MRISLDRWSELNKINKTVSRAWAIRKVFKTTKNECNPITPKRSRWTIEESEPVPKVERKSCARKKVSQLFT